MDIRLTVEMLQVVSRLIRASLPQIFNDRSRKALSDMVTWIDDEMERRGERREPK